MSFKTLKVNISRKITGYNLIYSLKNNTFAPFFKQHNV